MSFFLSRLTALESTQLPVARGPGATRIGASPARGASERASDAVAAVSERFSGHGLDRRGVKQAIAFHVPGGEWVSVSIAGTGRSYRPPAILQTPPIRSSFIRWTSESRRGTSPPAVFTR